MVGLKNDGFDGPSARTGLVTHAYDELLKLEKLQSVGRYSKAIIEDATRQTIRGMRITVSFILKLLASGESYQQILEAYPELEIEDLKQAVEYAAPTHLHKDH